MEIQLQLDGNGRTTWAKPAEKNDSKDVLEQGECKDALAQDAAAAAIDFSSKTVMTSLVPPSPPLETEESKQEHDEWRTWMDAILFDCEVSGCA